MLRLITDGKIPPEEAVRAYHGVLQAKNISPRLPLEKDLELTDQAMSCDGSAHARSNVAVSENPLWKPPPPGVATARAQPVQDSTFAQRVESHAWPLRANAAPAF